MEVGKARKSYVKKFAETIHKYSSREDSEINFFSVALINNHVLARDVAELFESRLNHGGQAAASRAKSLFVDFAPPNNDLQVETSIHNALRWGSRGYTLSLWFSSAKT
jgi:hypothetical protein